MPSGPFAQHCLTPQQRRQGGVARSTVLLIVAIGMIGGFALGRMSVRQVRMQTPVVPPAAAQPAQEAPRPASGPLATIALIGPGGGAPTFLSAAVAGPSGLLIVPLAPLDEITFVRTIAPQRDLQVVGVAPEAGLALLQGAADMAGAPGVSAEDGSLYLGRELLVVDSLGQWPGFVDSAAQRRSDGSYFYEATIDSDSPQGRSGGGPGPEFAVLLDHSGATILGLATAAGTDTGRFEAVDAAVIRALLDDRQRRKAADVAVFSATFFSTDPHGLLLRAQRRAQAGDWEGVIATATSLLDSGWHFRSAAEPLLGQAWQALANTAFDAGRDRETLALLAERKRHLAPGAQAALLEGRSLQRQGRFQEALQALHQARDLDPEVADAALLAIRSLVLNEIVVDDGLAPGQRAAILANEIASDPGHAPYHAALGDLHFDAGRYPESLSSYSHALQLRPSLESELQNRMATARQRLSTPYAAIVPVHNSGNILYVHGRVNGSQQSLRFILDTGASYTALTRSAANALGFPATGGRQVSLSTANGITTASLVTARSVELSGARVDNVDIVLLPALAGFDGLLGLSFLEHFNMDLDHGANELRLQRR